MDPKKELFLERKVHRRVVRSPDKSAVLPNRKLYSSLDSASKQSSCKDRALIRQRHIEAFISGKGGPQGRLANKSWDGQFLNEVQQFVSGRKQVREDEHRTSHNSRCCYPLLTTSRDIRIYC